MRFSTAAAVIGAAAVLVAGGTYAVQAATDSDTVRVCVKPQNGAVSFPSASGECGKNTTALDLASADGLTALEATVDQQASTIAEVREELAEFKEATAADLKELEPKPHLTGWSLPDPRQAGRVLLFLDYAGLMPNTGVRIFRHDGVEWAGHVVPDSGSVRHHQYSSAAPCNGDWFPLRLEATDKNGDPITATVPMPSC